jgi:hypothetical protein
MANGMAMLAYVTCLRAQMRCKVPDQTVHWGRKGLKRKKKKKKKKKKKRKKTKIE